MEEPTDHCVCWRVERFGFFSFTPCKLQHFQRADEEGSFILGPRILTVLGGLGFSALKSLELAESLVGFKLSGFPQGPIFSFACSLGSCLYSLP